MKRMFLSFFVALVGLTFVVAEVEAKRLGGGGNSGLKRQTPPPQQAAQAVPDKSTATSTPGVAGAAATPPKRSWMGPIAGIAAGLGLAALMSHLGMGADFANIITMVLVAVAGVVLIRFLMKRFGLGAAKQGTAVSPQGMQFAHAGMSGAGSLQARTDLNPGSSPGFQRAIEPHVADSLVAAVNTLPQNFDAPGFERIVKLIFIRMQAANDAGDLEDLRQFSTPEMFAAFRLELQDRKGMTQQTDVIQLDAQVLDFAQEAERQIVSVRFHGLLREEKDAPTTPFDEIWHLVKPTDGSREWAIAGIAQAALA